MGIGARRKVDMDEEGGDELEDDSNMTLGIDKKLIDMDRKQFDPSKMGEREIDEQLISQAMLKRKEWGKKYRISD